MTCTDQEVRMTCSEFQALPLHVDAKRPPLGQRWKVDLPRPVHSRACVCRIWVGAEPSAGAYLPMAREVIESGRYVFAPDCACVSSPALACEACRFKARWGKDGQKKRPNWYMAEYVENPHNSTFVTVKYRRLIVRLETMAGVGHSQSSRAACEVEPAPVTKAIADATGVPYEELTA